jgi:nucleotide-binding universal stress UspA family protein
MNRNETRGPASAATAKADIVVGLDGSPSAAAALRWAADHSRTTGLPLRVVHAWQQKALQSAAAPGSAPLWEASTADARARATQWVLDTLGGTAADVRWTLDIVEGPPGPVLAGRSRGARLLVLGTRGHTGLRRAVLGSVSHFCLSHAEPPVVAVPAREEPPVAGTGTGLLTASGPSS